MTTSDPEPDQAAEQPELGGVAEIAAEFGVPRTTVSMWDFRRETSGFPEPVAILAMGPVYDMAAVRAWHAAKPTRKGQS